MSRINSSPQAIHPPRAVGGVAVVGSGGQASFDHGHGLGIKGKDIASATALRLGPDGSYFHVTGTTTITSISTMPAGVIVFLEFDGALTFTHNATNLILHGAANRTTVAGDVCVLVSEGSGNWREIARNAAPYALSMSPITNSPAGNVALNNIANYFDGPSVAQGTTGTWFVSGTVTVIDTAGVGQFYVKLWDGTTEIASTELYTETANKRYSVSLSGYKVSPAGNLRISVKDISSTSGLITNSNNDGTLTNSSTITAIRIA